MRRALAVLAFAVYTAFPAAAQHDMEHMHHLPRAQGVKLDIQNDDSSHVLTMRLGPLDLPANAGMNVAQAPDLTFEVPFDGWFTGYQPRLVDDSGQHVPRRLLHHVAVYNLARADFLCRSKPEHIFGAGSEMNNWPVTPGIGYRVRQGDKILVATMFHNPTDKSYPRVYLEVKMNYLPSESGKPELKNIYPTWLDVKHCGNSSYDLAAGLNVTSGEFTMQYDGTLIGLGGHLHDYGRELHVVDKTRKQDVATLKANLDPEGRMLGIPVVLFLDRGGFPLAKGDVVKVTATYDNPTGHPLPDGAMGIAVGYFLPADDNELAGLRRGPAPARASAQKTK